VRTSSNCKYDGGLTKDFGEKASLTATYFSRRVHHLIVTVPAPGTIFGATAGNAGRADTQGVEIVPVLRPAPGLQLGGSVTILDQTHVSPTPNQRPTQVPKYSATALMEYTQRDLFRPEDRITTALAYTFVGDRDDITTAGTIANHDAYHRFDLAVSYSPGISWRWIRDEQIIVRIQNLLDRRYSEAFGFPAPPVNFLAGVKFDF
jgi:outer membrane receptor protein involved in Fe transport